MKRPPPRDSLAFLLLAISSDAGCYRHRWWKHRGFWTTLGYRVRRARKRVRWPLRLFMMPLDIITTIVRFTASDAELPSSAEIGTSLYLPHPQGVIMAGGCRIGPRVAIFQQVTLGNWEGKAPRIRSRASIFAGAKIIGGVTVGRRAFVGA